MPHNSINLHVPQVGNIVLESIPLWQRRVVSNQGFEYAVRLLQVLIPVLQAVIQMHVRIHDPALALCLHRIPLGAAVPPDFNDGRMNRKRWLT
jgi:hypothetical protein